MAWRSVVTKGGSELMQQWLNSAYTMRVTGAKGGTDTVEVEVLYQQTDVEGSKHTLSVTRTSRQHLAMPYSILEVDVQVRPEANAYTLRQIGVYGSLMDGETEIVGETLLSIYQAEDGDEVDVPSTVTMGDFVFEFRAEFNVNAAGDLAVTIDPDAYVSRADMSEALNTLVVKRIRTVETVGTADWHSPSDTWTQGGKSFAAPEDMYACAIAIEGVRAVSVVMDSWLEAGILSVPGVISYETMDDGWIMLTTAAVPTGSVDIGMMILV